LDANAPDATMLCAMAKRYVTNACFNVTNEALQLRGGYGYLSEYGVEKILRDLRVHQILEGTNEIMRLILARHIIGARDDPCANPCCRPDGPDHPDPSGCVECADASDVRQHRSGA